VAPSFNLEDPEIKLLDLDGDGVTDALRSSSCFECYFNHSKRGWYASRRIERRSLDQFPNVSFSDPRVKLADMTGDGLTDIVLVHDGVVEYWPYRGYGRWDERVVMRGSPRFQDASTDRFLGFDARRLQIGDVEGDRRADI